MFYNVIYIYVHMYLHWHCETCMMQWDPRCRVRIMSQQGSLRADGDLGGDRDPRRPETPAHGCRSHAHQGQFKSMRLSMTRERYKHHVFMTEPTGHDDRRGGGPEETLVDQYQCVQERGDVSVWRPPAARVSGKSARSTLFEFLSSFRPRGPEGQVLDLFVFVRRKTA